MYIFETGLSIKHAVNFFAYPLHKSVGCQKVINDIFKYFFCGQFTALAKKPKQSIWGGQKNLPDLHEGAEQCIYVSCFKQLYSFGFN